MGEGGAYEEGWAVKEAVAEACEQERDRGIFLFSLWHLRIRRYAIRSK